MWKSLRSKTAVEPLIGGTDDLSLLGSLVDAALVDAALVDAVKAGEVSR